MFFFEGELLIERLKFFFVDVEFRRAFKYAEFTRQISLLELEVHAGQGEDAAFKAYIHFFRASEAKPMVVCGEALNNDALVAQAGSFFH